MIVTVIQIIALVVVIALNVSTWRRLARMQKREEEWVAGIDDRRDGHGYLIHVQ